MNSRPDLCSRLGYLQSHINKAKVSTLTEANKTLHEVKVHSNVTIKIQPIKTEDLRFAAFSDASFASEKVQDSHQGMVIMACHRLLGQNRTSIVNPMLWHSKKIQKVAVSTLSAEAMALAGAVDMLSWVRLYWDGFLTPNCHGNKLIRPCCSCHQRLQPYHPWKTPNHQHHQIKFKHSSRNYRNLTVE